MLDYKITRFKQIMEQIRINYGLHNYYWLVQGRLYNRTKTMYKKFKFIISFGVEDVCEYYDKDFVTKEEIKQYAQELACSHVGTATDFDNATDFYRVCNETIENYNDIIRG